MSAPIRQENKPYKGPRPYEVADALIFHGRKRETDQLIAKILSAPITLLHAQSGAGKTSLINAKMIPALEQRGWTPVRIRPESDPVAAVRNNTLRYVVPPPRAEASALERLLQYLAPANENPSFGELLNRYDTLRDNEELKRLLISPVPCEIPDTSMTPAAVEQVMPYACRVIRSSLEIGSLADYLAILAQGASAEPTHTVTVSEATPSRDLVEILSSSELAIAYRELMTFLDTPGRELLPFFERLTRRFGSRQRGVGFVLIFDQFEELFTRFLDPGRLSRENATNRPLSWRFRYELFNELRSFHDVFLKPDSNLATSVSANNERSPSRVLIAMRSEYIGQLGPVYQFAHEIDQSIYYLDFLSVDEALEAIRNPAKTYGYGYSQECYKEIMRDLTKEDRFIEPAQLSLVCEKLWDESGRVLAQPARNNDDDERLPQIDLPTYQEKLGGAPGILRAFIFDFLEAIDDRASRIEMLEMLEQLITGSGTRNIVERRQLINAAFRNSERRNRLLDRMIERAILRSEPRLGSLFIEITHEFLIGPVQEALRKHLYSDTDYVRLRAALRGLDAAQRQGNMTDGYKALQESDFRVLNGSRTEIKWTEKTAELMLRAGAVYGCSPDMLRYWAEEVSGSEAAVSVQEILESMGRMGVSSMVLEPAELRRINEERATLRLSDEQMRLVFRSVIVHAKSGEEHDVKYWTKRMTS